MTHEMRRPKPPRKGGRAALRAASKGASPSLFLLFASAPPLVLTAARCCGQCRELRARPNASVVGGRRKGGSQRRETSAFSVCATLNVLQ
jgi:hypothetical protein